VARYERGDRVELRRVSKLGGTLEFIVGPDSMGPRQFGVKFDDGTFKYVSPRVICRPTGDASQQRKNPG
jgi:hypothetical protein